MATPAASTDKSTPYFPLAGLAKDGWSKDDEATATCLCGAVQLAFVSRSLFFAVTSSIRDLPAPLWFGSPSLRESSPVPPTPSPILALRPSNITVFNTTSRRPQPTDPPGLVNTFVCNCPDCHKITASAFASNFTVDDKYLQHLRGRDNLTTFSQSHTVASGNTMTNFFCSTCGSLMYRVSSGLPGLSILRIGSVDDFHLQETKLRPQKEAFTKYRLGWVNPVAGAKQLEEASGLF
ncbi:MAG: hypothetical protein LQ352_004982 [Teloschistes flavicans]|nr:MAG: hypothetical protein LQ352_004982 [Teloschistes flavicans]